MGASKVKQSDWTTMTRDRWWWVAASPLIVIGFLAADLSLASGDTMAFILIAVGLMNLPAAVIMGVAPAFGFKMVDPLERRLFRAALIAIVIGALAFGLFGTMWLPWWVAVLPATVCYWLYAWLKAGPSPTPDDVAKVFD